MRIIIFGAAGFVGRNLIEILSQEGHVLVGADVKDDPFSGSVSYVKVDLLDRNRVFECAKGCDVVVHLAASPLVASLDDPQGNMKVNVEGTLNILDAARKHDVRKVIYSSASSVVGIPKYNPVDEDHPCSPKTPYAVAKKACEDYLKVYNELYGLQYLVFRFFNLYGPWQTFESGALIPNMYRKLAEGKNFEIFGDGSNTRDFIYVEDVGRFCSLAIKDNVKNQVLNMGTGVGTSITELIETSARLLRVTPKISYKPARPGEIGNFVANNERLLNSFGHRPFTPLQQGLGKTFSWLRDH